MANRLPLTNADGEVRELTEEDFKQAAPFSALPESLRDKLTAISRGPQTSSGEERIAVRLSRQVVESFRASGQGWQARMDTALKDWLRTHSPS